MEYSELVREIVARVTAYLEAGIQEKQKLVILNHKSEELCHSALRCPKLNAYYELDCAMSNGYQVDMEAADGLMVFDLTNDQLSRITAGICDSPFASVVEKALLLKKPVFVPREEIELLQYDTATPYGQMMLEKLRCLEKLGAIIAPYSQLLPIVLDKTGNAGAGMEKPMGETAHAVKTAAAEKPVKELDCPKKLITEKDVTIAAREGYTRIFLQKKAIVTDLAKEYAQTNRIEIIKG